MQIFNKFSFGWFVSRLGLILLLVFGQSSGQFLLPVGVGLLALCRCGLAQSLVNQLVSPPPPGVGLYSMVQKLQEQVLQMEQLHEHDRHRLKRLERRNREYNKNAMTASEEIVQLKQHIVEIQEQLAASEETSGNINLEISRLDYEQRRIKAQVVQLQSKHSTQTDRTPVDERSADSQSLPFQNITETFDGIFSDLQMLKDKQSSHSVALEKNSAVFKHIKQLLKFRVRQKRSDKEDKFAASQGNATDSIQSGNSSDQDVWTSDETSSGDAESGDMEFTDPDELLFWNGAEGSGSLENITEKDDISDWLKLKVIDLEEKLNQVEVKVSSKLDVKAENALVLMMKNLLQTHDVYFEKEILKRDSLIKALEEYLAVLTSKVSEVEKRVLSIQLGDFMQKLQESMINFTQHVITIDQWNLASNQIINSTQYNQRQIMELTAMIMNNSKAINQMEWKVVEQRSLSDQQFRVLRMHIIRLNNTVQDLREHIDYLGTIKTRGMQKEGSYQSPSGDTNYHSPQRDYQGSQRTYQRPHQDHNGPRGNYQNSHGDVMTKMEELSLQIVYNENRIGKLENKVLNQSLFECKKTNTDLFQDSRLHRMDQDLAKMRHKAGVVEEVVRRVDRSMYRIHANTKNNTHVINKLSSVVSMWDVYFPVIQLLRQEVDNLLSQVPTDCQEYYERGFHKSGMYIIFPRGAPQSLSVQCQMVKDGAWTVIQQRIDGSENFARTWTEYAVGFGKSNGEYWLGNEFLNHLTSHKNYSLQIDMVDIFNEHWVVEYDEFSVSPKEDDYKLYIYGFHGNATDSMDYSDGVPFSTQDRDNDLSSTHCASYFTAGWWYRHCQYSNLNGRYDSGIVWFNYDWQDWIQMKSARMMIKPTS